MIRSLLVVYYANMSASSSNYIQIESKHILLATEDLNCRDLRRITEEPRGYWHRRQRVDNKTNVGLAYITYNKTKYKNRKHIVH